MQVSQVVAADLDVDIPDEMISEVVANVHLAYFSELAELLVNLLVEVLELLSGEAGEKGMKKR